MKTKIILGLATIAALALPAMAEEGNRYRDHDQRAYYSQNYRYDDDDARRAYDSDDFRRAAREQRERREQQEKFREHRDHDGDRR
jgi:hypothetical protein